MDAATGLTLSDILIVISIAGGAAGIVGSLIKFGDRLWGSKRASGETVALSPQSAICAEQHRVISVAVESLREADKSHWEGYQRQVNDVLSRLDRQHDLFERMLDNMQEHGRLLNQLVVMQSSYTMNQERDRRDYDAHRARLEALVSQLEARFEELSREVAVARKSGQRSDVLVG